MTALRVSNRIPRVGSALVLMMLVLVPDKAEGLGGFYGRTPPEEPVVNTNDAIVYGLTGNTVTMQIQLQYKGVKSESTPQAGNFGGGVNSGGILFRQHRPQLGRPQIGGGTAPQQQAGQTEPQPFGWILPLPSAPTRVETGSAMLFETLFQSTRPNFKLHMTSGSDAEEGVAGSVPESTAMTCSVEGLTDGCEYTNEGPFRGRPQGGMFGGGNVLEEGTAGMFDYAVLTGSTTEEVVAWLDEHEFTHDAQPDFVSKLEQYVNAGHVFLAVQLNTDAPTGALQPLLIEYELPPTGPQRTMPIHSVPLMLTQQAQPAGASDGGLDLNIYVLSDQLHGRAVPINYMDIELDDVHVDWVGCYDASGGEDACYWKDYLNRVHHVVEETIGGEGAGGTTTTTPKHSLVTEYAGPTIELRNMVGVDLEALTPALSASSTWLEFVNHLQEASIPADNELLQDILLDYIPLKFMLRPPAEACSQWTQIYHPNPASDEPTHQDCFQVFYAPAGWSWDPVGLEQALRQQVFVPTNQALEWMEQFQWMTRLLGYIPPATDKDVSSSIDSIQQEPHFAIDTTPETSLVSNLHHAKATPVCPDGDGMNPTSLKITLLKPSSPQQQEDASTATSTTAVSPSSSLLQDSGISFWQPAFLNCGWKKSQRYILWDMDQAIQMPWSYAQKFIAHGIANEGALESGGGGIEVTKDESLGILFDPIQMESAIAFGDALLAQLTSGATVTAATKTTARTDKTDPDGDFRRNLSSVADSEEPVVQQENVETRADDHQQQLRRRRG